MAVTIGKSPSYFWLNSWILANIIELATQDFCDRYVDYRLDPGRRLYDQMTQSARSIRANIAEGSGRHDTSLQTEMRLTDVARASTHEVLGDFLNFMMRKRINPWLVDSPEYQEVITFRMPNPVYGKNIICDVMKHIITQKSRLDKYLEAGDAALAANALTVLCFKEIAMLTQMLESQLKEFRANGGFTENMTQERMEAKRQQSLSSGAPNCPKCGKPMVRRMTQKSLTKDPEFWGCSDYPACNGIINIQSTQP